MLHLKATVMKTVVDNEIVLLDKESGVYYGLNETASRMLELALANTPQETAVQTLQDEFNADALTIQKDFGALKKDLIEKGLAFDSQESQ